MPTEWTRRASDKGLQAVAEALDRNTAALSALDTKVASAAGMTALKTSVDGLSTKAATEAGIQQVNAQITEVNAKTPDVRTDFMAGRIRTAGGRAAVASAAMGVFQLQNPAGSGKVCTLLDFTLASDVNADAGFRVDGVVASPTVLPPFMPNRAYEGFATTSGIARMGVAGYSSPGTTLSPIYRLPANFPVQKDFVVVLLPGMTVSVNVTAAALGALVFYVSASWSEDPM